MSITAYTDHIGSVFSFVQNSDTASDLQLVEQATTGDHSAFEELFNRHHKRVYALCLRMTHNVSQSEDLTQEVFITLHRKLHTFRGDSAFTTWLHRITVNQVLMEFRRPRFKSELTTEDGTLPEQTVNGSANFRRMQVFDKIALDNAIAQLPPGYQTMFVMHDVEGYSHDEIAKILGCSSGTCKSQLHKARQKMQKLLSAKKNPRLMW